MTENNESENRRIDNEGNYNERIDGNYVQGTNNFLNNTFALFTRPGNSEALTSAKHYRIRQALLKQVNNEVEIRRNSSLHNRVYIVLDVEKNPEQIELPWASEIKVENKPKKRLDNTDIISVFDQEDVAGRLLILGQPGSGKTTMLLKLAGELVNRANNDSTYPVPVLFSLSSWKNDNQSIKDWLVDQLKDKHGLRKDIGKQLVNNQEIIPLLDGLDELAAERQEKCVIKINEFLHPSNWNNPVIVCSRIQEYERYASLLQLNNSLELYPFSPQQVYQYLQNTDNLQLWNSISNDADLSQLAKTPLLLNIIVLSAQEISIPTWQQFNSSEERLSYLFDAYIRRMFKRLDKGKDKQPKLENTQRWLSYLAYRLTKESTTEFLIEKIQPDWLNEQFQKLIYNLIFWGFTGSLINGLIWGIYGLTYVHKNQFIFGLFNGLIVGLITGLIVGLFSVPLNQLIENILQKQLIFINPLKLFSKKIIKGISIGLISGLIYAIYGLTVKLFLGLTDIFVNIFDFYTFSEITTGLIIGLIYGLVEETIQTVENLKFSFKSFQKSLVEWLFFGLFIGEILAIILFLIYKFNEILLNNLTKSLFEYLMIDLHNILLLGIGLGLSISVIGILISGITGIEIENKVYPNQGIWRSVKNSIILSIVTSLLGTVVIFIILNNTKNILAEQLLTNSILSGFSLGLLIGIPRGGTSAIKHFILRMILWFNGYIPWNYGKFLNYSAKGLFLQRIGGSYRFIHDLLRQHWANYYTQSHLTLIHSNPRAVQKSKFKNILLVTGIIFLIGCTSWQFHLRDAIDESYNFHGISFGNKKDYDHSIAYFTKLIKLDPNDANAYYNRGLAYSNKKEYDRAISDYNQAIKLDPNYADAYNNRGNAYDNKKEYDRAITDYNQAIKLDPKSAYAYYNRGNAYSNKKDYDRAITDYDQAIKLDPNHAIAYYNRGLAYYNKKEYDRAISDYNQAIKLDPKSAYAYDNRGNAYSNKKEYDRAITDYNQTIKLNPNDANAYYNRGIVYDNKKDYDRAISDYNQAIKLDPNNTNAYYNRGVAYYNKKDYDRAITDYNQAIKLDPKSAYAYNNRGNVYSYRGDYSHAFADFAQSLRLDAKNAEAYYNRGIAYKNTGSKDKAIEDFKKVRELNNDVELSQKASQKLQELNAK